MTLKEMWEEYKRLDAEQFRLGKNYIEIKDNLYEQNPSIAYKDLEENFPELKKLQLADREGSHNVMKAYAKIIRILKDKVYDLGNGKYLVHGNCYGDEYLEEKDAYTD